jgi:hypothetical protein
MLWTISAENRARESMTIANKPPEIPPVCPEQIGIALALFRAAVLDEGAEETILPLRDRCIRTALLGPTRCNVDFELSRFIVNSDSIHAVWQRVVCFLQLLRGQNQNPHPLWNEIVTHHNRFVPIVNAIAWCPAHRGKAFDVVMFAKITSHMADTLIDCATC